MSKNEVSRVTRTTKKFVLKTITILPKGWVIFPNAGEKPTPVYVEYKRSIVGKFSNVEQAEDWIDLVTTRHANNEAQELPRKLAMLLAGQEFKPPVLTKAEVLTQAEMVERYPLGNFDDYDSPSIFFIGPTWESIYSLPLKVNNVLTLGDKIISSYAIQPIEDIKEQRNDYLGSLESQCSLESWCKDYHMPGFDISDEEWDAEGFKVAWLPRYGGLHSDLRYAHNR